MPKETIHWYTTQKPPKVDRRNRLNGWSVMAEENPTAANKPFHPVMFVLGGIRCDLDGRQVVAGRYFPDKVRGLYWFSLQGSGYCSSEIRYWAEVPKGPRR